MEHEFLLSIPFSLLTFSMEHNSSLMLPWVAVHNNLAVSILPTCLALISSKLSPINSIPLSPTFHL
uniref:Uncharacterized protein n=1 Tax=Rhizophora mucronata TaxID=61149 RepID=A0A2P2MXK0_RHIMU